LMAEEFGSGVFGDSRIAVDSATRAIAAFERTAVFAPFSSKYDNSLAGAVVLSDLEKEGLKLFDDPVKGNCTRCHAFTPFARRPADLLFTDFGYHAIGVPRNARIPANADAAFFDLGLCGPRRDRVADDRLCGAFKVPTLRNVARRPALMHNGFFTNLRDVVAFYATRDSNPARWYPAGMKFDDLPALHRGNVDVTIVPYVPAPGSTATLTEHEIDEVLGMGSHLNSPRPEFLEPTDLFSWASLNARNTSASGERFFSIDRGLHFIAQFNQNPEGDFGDFDADDFCPAAWSWPCS